jgi:hypothetical protein
MTEICPKCDKPAICIDTVGKKAYHKIASRVEFFTIVDDKDGVCCLTQEEVNKYLADLKAWKETKKEP